MKKIILSLLSVIIMLSFTAVCRAQTIEDANNGISYVLSDDWVLKEKNDSLTTFFHISSSNENVFVETTNSSKILSSVEEMDDDVLKGICEEIYSDSALELMLAKTNNTDVTVKTESVVSSREYYNGIMFYRYEKAYTASAKNLKPTGLYLTLFITMKNNRLYTIGYERDNTKNHFNDVANMLNSLSFESGRIKIKINGEMIYPDSDPFIYEGRTLVPIRAIAEKMNYSVAWDAENQLVILRSDSEENILHFRIDNLIALRNYKEFELDVPATIIDGRTYLPIRAVVEAMDAKVNWNQNERTIEITR